MSSSGGSTGENRNTADRVVVLNPVSGDGSHVEKTRSLADQYGFDVRETQTGGDARQFAREAVEAGAVRIGACGGDGTVNEVVRGIDDADGFDRVTVGVLPGGTGNNFAANLGVEDLQQGFEVLATGATRTIDLGVANDQLFVNSCVCGLTADASEDTSLELKDRLGEFAYVIETIESMTDFDPIPLRVHAGADDEPEWHGDAVFVLIGNARRFPAGGDEQANVEDGRLDVTIIGEVPTTDLLRDTMVERLLGQNTETTARLMADTLDIEVTRDEPAQFSFDGEIDSFRELSCSVRTRTLSVRVGEGYVPNPDI